MTMSELKPVVQETLELVKGKVSVENGTFKLAEGTEDAVMKPFLEKNGITEKQFTAVQDHVSAVGAAVAIEAAEVAAEAFKKDKGVENLSGELKVGRTTISYGVTRKRVYPNPSDKANPITKYGVVDVDYDTKHVMSKKTVNKHVARFYEGLSD